MLEEINKIKDILTVLEKTESIDTSKYIHKEQLEDFYKYVKYYENGSTTIPERIDAYFKLKERGISIKNKY